MPARTDSLLRYRPWKGAFRPPLVGAIAIARTCLTILLRHKLFWAVYANAGLVFLAYFFCQVGAVWLPQRLAGRKTDIETGVVKLNIEWDKFLPRLLDALQLNGTAHTFANFAWFQGHVTMIALALAGGVAVGNDFHHGSLAFYLSKPTGRREYAVGKVLGVGGLVHLLVTIPAVVLWVQAGLLQGWRAYYLDNWHLLVGILGYGLLLSVVLPLLLVATAVMVRRTVPLVLVWCGLFVLVPRLAGILATNTPAGPAWRLLDLWNNLYLIGLYFLGGERTEARTGFEQPPVWQAALVTIGVAAACWVYLRRRVRAVEVVK